MMENKEINYAWRRKIMQTISLSQAKHLLYYDNAEEYQYDFAIISK